MANAFLEIRETARERDTDLRTAGYVVAIETIVRVDQVRDILP